MANLANVVLLEVPISALCMCNSYAMDVLYSQWTADPVLVY